MSLFRRKTIFHAEEALPDPEEIKLRFRRRVLLLTFLGFLLVLAIPVARDLKTDLTARAETRKLGERILETRTLAAKARAPVSLELADDNRTWRRVQHGPGERCDNPAPGPRLEWSTEEVSWKLQVQKESGETISGRTLCLHPLAGVELDTDPVGQGKLLVTASKATGGPEQEEAAYLFVTDYGAEIQALYNAKR